MTVNYPQLFFGLMLLWFPRQWMRFGATVGRRRRRAPSDRRTEEPPDRAATGSPRIDVRREFGKLRNYFDLLRAAAGSLAIIGGTQIPPSLAMEGETYSTADWKVLAIKFGILLVGLLIQVLRVERQHLSLFAPVFYLAGLSVSLCSIWGAVFSFILIWGMNPMLGTGQAFLLVYGIAMGLFGFFLQESDARLPAVALLMCFVPVLISLLAGRPLVVPSRKASHPPAGAA